MHEVKDGNRRIRFDGELLGYSTSYRPGAERWVEFTLFRTIGGAFVVSRVGMSVLYHRAGCSIADRAGLPPTPRAALPPDRYPCGTCNPHEASSDTEMVCVEIPRNWAQTADSAAGVVDLLYQRDESGARYLTGVAKRLLEEASQMDASINEAYNVEIIY